MADVRAALIDYFNQSPLRELSGELLRSIPGLPPILQTVHLLGAAVLMGSVVMLSLRLLGVAATNQYPAEMSKRLLPWFLGALPAMLLSALPFFLARPQRYLSNPVFDIKMFSLLLTLGLSVWLWQRCRTLSPGTLVTSTRLLAAAVICGWVFTTLAGRWIAYADYIFWSD